MNLTKLDYYEYVILPGIIRIAIDGSNDPTLVDILSQIDRSDGAIYVEGYYYKYLDRYSICILDDNSYMELEVLRVA